MRGNAAQDEQVRQNVDNVRRLELLGNADSQTFVRELIDDVQHPVLSTLMRAVLDKVVRPDMVRPLGPQTDAGSVIEPEPTPLRLFGWHFQPLAPPDPLDPLVIDDPASGRSQELRDIPVAVAAILASEFDDVGGQSLFVISPRRRPPLRRSMLSEYAANPAFGQLQLRSDVIDAGASTRGDQ